MGVSSSTTSITASRLSTASSGTAGAAASATSTGAAASGPAKPGAAVGSTTNTTTPRVGTSAITTAKVGTSATTTAKVGTSVTTKVGTSATTAAGAVPQSLRTAEARVQSQVDATGAQISSLGRLQSALAGAQTAAGSLSHLGSATADSLTAVLQGFAAAYNAAVAAAHTAATGSAESTRQTSAGRHAGSGLRQAVAGNQAALQALRNIGVQQASDGTITVDAAALAAARAAHPQQVGAALDTLGAAVVHSTTASLATNGSVGASLDRLAVRTTALKAQYGALQQMVQSRLESAETTAVAANKTSAWSSIDALFGSS